MNGIPVRIRRDERTEMIYLSTRRTGDVGEKMKALKKRVHDAEAEASAALSRVVMISEKAEALNKSSPDYGRLLDELMDQQEKFVAAASVAKDKVLEAAEELVRLSLQQNYQEAAEVDRIMDSLSDRQFRQAVSAIETGEEPKDFFHEPVTPASATTT